MMNCAQIHECIDDYLDGTLPAGEQQFVQGHLSACESCQSELAQVQSLRQALRAMPVPPPSANFSDRIFARARKADKNKRLAIGGLSTALAASLVMWMGVAMFQPENPTVGLDAIVMGVSDTREVKLVFNAPEAFDKVTLKLELNGNIELAGFTGKNTVKWQTRLKKGANSLVLPINATGTGQAEVIAKIIHDGKTKTFRLPVTIQRTGAQVLPAQTKIAV